MILRISHKVHGRDEVFKKVIFYFIKSEISKVEQPYQKGAVKICSMIQK